jgi:hypothetical protein
MLHIFFFSLSGNNFDDFIGSILKVGDLQDSILSANQTALIKSIGCNYRFRPKVK